MERDAGGRGQIQRIDFAAHRDSHAHVRQRLGLLRQSRPFAADEQRHPLVCWSRASMQFDRIVARRQRHNREPFALQCPQIARPVVQRARTELAARCPSRCGSLCDTADRSTPGSERRSRRTRRRSGTRCRRCRGRSRPRAPAPRSAPPITSASGRSVGRCASARQPRCRLKPVIGGEIVRVAHVDRHVRRHARQWRLERLERRVVEEHRYDACPLSRRRPTTSRPSATKQFLRRSNSASDTFR